MKKTLKRDFCDLASSWIVIDLKHIKVISGIPKKKSIIGRLFLSVEIFLTTEPIDYSIFGNLHEGPGMTLILHTSQGLGWGYFLPLRIS